MNPNQLTDDLDRVFSRHAAHGTSSNTWFALAGVAVRALISISESAAQLARVGKPETAAVECLPQHPGNCRCCDYSVYCMCPGKAQETK